MNELVKKHLRKVTVDKLMEFRSNAFICCWSARGVSLGVNSTGGFIVKDSNGEDHTFSNPAIAIEKYKELLNQ